jgi:hypothetical protein
MTYFNQTFLTNIFGRYCGHLQGEIITRIQKYSVVSCVVSPKQLTLLRKSSDDQKRRFIHLSLRQEKVFEREKDSNISVIHVHLHRLRFVMTLREDCI